MPLTYRPDIDGLRAIAVLAVVVFHAFPGQLPGGFFGVDVFFVISGYLITTLILGGIERHTFSIADFYQRRIIRIFPSLITVLIACLVFGWLALFADEFEQLGKHVAAGAGFVSNLVLLGESGYFDTSAATKPLLHLWSLGIEEQFYIAWPLLLAVVAPRRLWLWPLLLALALASVVLNLYLLYTHPTGSYYLPVSRLWELLLGGLLAHLSAYGTRPERRFPNVQSIAGIALLAGAFLLIDHERTPPIWWGFAALPAFGALLVISAGQGAWLNSRVLSHRALAWIGLISYPLYLWHWPLLTFARMVESRKPDVPIRLAAVAVAVVLAWLTYQLIEQPLRGARRRTSVTVGLCAAMLVVGSAGYLVYAQRGFSSRPTIQGYSWNGAVTEQFAGPKWAYTTNAQCQNRFPFADAISDGWWFCMLSKDQSPTLAILGNSYANQLYPGLASHPALSGQTLLSIGACQPVIEREDDLEGEPGNPCTGRSLVHQRRFIDDLITRTPTIKFIIIDGLDPEPHAGYITQLAARIAFFEKAGAKVVVFTPHLRPDFDIRGCFSRPLRQVSRGCEVEAAERRLATVRFQPLVSSIAISNPAVSFFDPNDLFCDDDRCRFVVDGLPLYRDEHHHLSEYASRIVAERFVAWARGQLPGLVTLDR